MLAKVIEVEIVIVVGCSIFEIVESGSLKDVLISFYP